MVSTDYSSTNHGYVGIIHGELEKLSVCSSRLLAAICSQKTLPLFELKNSKTENVMKIEKTRTEQL